jgi:hypothetical protein
VPEVATDPLHAPLPVHDVAFADDQLSVALEPRAIETGFADKLTDGGGTVTFTVAEPLFEASAVEVAVIEAMPVVAGMNTPLLLTAPMLDGLTDQVTELLKAPVPATLALHEDV